MNRSVKDVFCYSTLAGKLAIAALNGNITNVFFYNEAIAATMHVKETAVISEAARQLDEYFAGLRQTFELALAPEGTAFQQSVWAALRQIPYGKTCSYKDIAQKIGLPKAYRAVGMANNRNPIAIIIPCHRVIGADGKLVGYAGGLEIKSKLLALEAKQAKLNFFCL